MCLIAQAVPQEDLVQNLPGLVKQPTFKQYSGYLEANDGKFLHYWFTESVSQPENDPLVLWLNGGPGCSSIIGLLTENGPFTVGADGKNLTINPFSWNKQANVIFLEAPAGVGYSYSKSRQYKTGDKDTAKNNLAALKSFFIKFPEYKNHNFFITGESYGGIYVPTLVIEALRNSSFNLRGFAVGNGISDWSLNTNSAVYLMYYHGFVSDLIWNQTLKACCQDSPKGRCDFYFAMNKSSECKILVNKVQSFLNDGIDPYNIYHQTSTEGEAVLSLCNEDNSKFSSWPFSNFYYGVRSDNSDGLQIYMNRPDVRKALHIQDDLPRWTECAGLGYKIEYKTMMPQYHEALSKGLHVMIYNGDIDMVCNFLQDEWFSDQVHGGGRSKFEPWYYSDKKNGGFITRYSDKFRFVTVRGAGHMVPTDRPEPALKMFQDFIKSSLNN